jgi:hypothetical protein
LDFLPPILIVSYLLWLLLAQMYRILVVNYLLHLLLIEMHEILVEDSPDFGFLLALSLHFADVAGLNAGEAQIIPVVVALSHCL